MIDIAAIERDNTKKSCLEKAIIISNKRKKVGIKLSQLIKKGLVDLGIPNATWLVSFRETDISETGIDDIEFMFTANPDFPPEPLKSVASGGELSRIMLILALEISKVFESKIVLFDEPDVGLGGAVAEKLGEKIAQLSKSSQVLCISHLPQVASFADTHFLISKKLENGKTNISINNLSRDQRVAEIARMLSGTKIEDEALVLARKMVR
jgi:DNA repair protein RecN (Recombination protein N)